MCFNISRRCDRSRCFPSVKVSVVRDNVFHYNVIDFFGLLSVGSCAVFLRTKFFVSLLINIVFSLFPGKAINGIW